MIPEAEELLRAADEASDIKLALILAAHDGYAPMEVAEVVLREWSGPLSVAIQDLLNVLAKEEVAA